MITEFPYGQSRCRAGRRIDYSNAATRSASGNRQDDFRRVTNITRALICG